MSNQDSFLSEVTEEVRRDRLYKLFRKYGWIAAVLIVLVVGGAALNEWRKARAAAEAQAVGDAILAALEADGAEAQSAALSGLESGGNAARSAILALLRADAALEQGDRAAALSELADVAGDADAPPAYRDLATLKWAIVGSNETSPEDRIARLDVIAVGTSAFRLLALEQIALAEVERGNVEAALGTLNEIVNDAAVTQDLRVRAAQLIVALDGEPSGG